MYVPFKDANKMMKENVWPQIVTLGRKGPKLINQHPN